jgi:predicted regulator of Ras-like GTPase activity (Roadblock/LC7/MglB family)
MNHLHSSLSPSLVTLAHEHANAIVNELAGVTAVIVATTDGFDIASSVRIDIDSARLAALASSIAAIGEVVSAEARLGSTRCVTVETDSGFAVAYRVARLDVPMVIKVLGGPDAVLAQVKYRAAAAATLLRDA